VQGLEDYQAMSLNAGGNFAFVIGRNQDL
jgi:hypothetical protein